MLVHVRMGLIEYHYQSIPSILELIGFARSSDVLTTLISKEMRAFEQGGVFKIEVNKMLEVIEYVKSSKNRGLAFKLILENIKCDLKMTEQNIDLASILGDEKMINRLLDIYPSDKELIIAIENLINEYPKK